ncbi:MAG: PEP-CTERM sorting domain-containing protein [Planctomycetota bacterium]
MPNFLVRPNNGNVGSTFVIDNIAIDTSGENLTAFNIPEPGAMTLLGAGLALLAGRRRKQEAA